MAQLLENGPQAMAETKACILESSWGGFDRAAFDALVASHAAKRQIGRGRRGPRLVRREAVGALGTRCQILQV